jgi:hypothetical protein
MNEEDRQRLDMAPSGAKSGPLIAGITLITTGLALLVSEVLRCRKRRRRFLINYTPIPVTTNRVEAALMGTGDGPDAFAAQNTFTLTAVFPENVPTVSDVFVSVRQIDDIDESADFFTIALGRTFLEGTDLTVRPSYPDPSDQRVIAIQLAFRNGSIGRRTPILVTVGRDLLAPVRRRRGIVVVFVRP